MGRPSQPQPLPVTLEGATGPSHWHTLQAPGDWQTVDLISDLHLNAAEPDTAEAFFAYLAQAPCSALLVLGDLFEVWVGDDLPEAGSPQDHAEAAFARRCRQQLAEAAQRLPIYVMHGNRDFLLGPDFFRATQTTHLPDPTVLHGPSGSTLLTHGDAWCLDDVDYQVFRRQVRQGTWQRDFLGQPRTQREAFARQLRAQSEAAKAASRAAGQAQSAYADVDTPTALQWLSQTGATRLVHGHTHRPAVHPLAEGQERWVLSDWDARTNPTRLEVLRWDLAQNRMLRFSLPQPPHSGH